MLKKVIDFWNDNLGRVHKNQNIEQEQHKDAYSEENTYTSTSNAKSFWYYEWRDKNTYPGPSTYPLTPYTIPHTYSKTNNSNNTDSVEIDMNTYYKEKLFMILVRIADDDGNTIYGSTEFVKVDLHDFNEVAFTAFTLDVGKRKALQKLSKVMEIKLDETYRDKKRYYFILPDDNDLIEL